MYLFFFKFYFMLMCDGCNKIKKEMSQEPFILFSFHFTLMCRLCMKLFKTGSTDVVKDCQGRFAIDLPSCDLKRRQDRFVLRYVSTVNGFCQFRNKL